MGAVEKLVNIYWVNEMSVHSRPRTSSMHSFRYSLSFLHLDSRPKLLKKCQKKQIVQYKHAANGRCEKTGPYILGECIDSRPKLLKKCQKSKLCDISVQQMGDVKKLAHSYCVNVLSVLGIIHAEFQILIFFPSS